MPTSDNNIIRLHFTTTSLLSFLFLTIRSPTVAAPPPLQPYPFTTHRFVRTVSGHQVPTHLVRRLLRQKLPTTRLKQALYEITPEKRLRGHDGLDVNLLHHTKPLPLAELSDIKSHPASVSINGVPHSPHIYNTFQDSGESFIRTGDRFTVALRDDGTVLAVWVDGLSLVPLHTTRHPHVFVNIDYHLSSTSHPTEAPPQLNDATTAAPNNDASSSPTNSSSPSSSSSSGAASGSGVAASDPSDTYTCRNRRPPRLFELAVAFDNFFCDLYGNIKSDAIRAARGAIVAANRPFAKQTCIRLRITHFDGHCNSKQDPYVPLYQLIDEDNFEMLYQLEALWLPGKSPEELLQTRRNVTRDATLLLIGFKHMHFWGQAYIGDTCNGRGYAWAERVRVATIAHELGHLLGCEHTDYGIMKSGASIAKGTPMIFADESVDQLVAYVDRRTGKANCLDIPDSFLPPQASPTPSTSPDPVVITSMSPKPSVQATTSPSALPTPKIDISKCAIAVSKRKGYTCVSADMPKILSNAGPCSVKITQRFARLDVILEALPRRTRTGEGGAPSQSFTYRIMGYATIVSTNGSLSEDDLPAMKRTGRWGTQKETIQRQATALDLGAGTKSCCGQLLYVYILVRMRRVDRVGAEIKPVRVTDDTRTARYKWTVKCRLCSPGKIVIPPNATTQCATCLVRKLNMHS